MRRILVAITLCLGMSGVLFAQQRNGSIKGQVLDELGGAIIGVTVTAIDSNGVEKTATTNTSTVTTPTLRRIFLLRPDCEL